MKKKCLVFGLAAFALISSSLYADADVTQLDANVAVTKKAAAKEGWQGSISLGYLATTGNTNTRSLNGQALAGYKSGPWQGLLSLQAPSPAKTG
ncbi:MAG: hypothetical protein ACYDCJ_08420 [Gammaproteobacteria bacterium]